MITETGKGKVRNLVSSDFTVMKIGNGGDSTNPNATDLDAPIASATTTNITSGQSAIDFKATFSGSQISGQTIKEVGIFNTDGTPIMLGRVNFKDLGPFTSSDSIEIIVTMEIE
jgi:hypothetical protein